MGIQSSRSRYSARLRAMIAALAVLALASAAAVGTGAAGAAGPSAKAAGSLNLSDSASLHMDNHKGVELKESGSAKGNLPGSIFLQLKLPGGHGVSAQIQVYPSSRDSVTASATATYHLVTSSSASFSGRLNITGGRGRYAKAKGSGLSFSGTVHRPSESVSVHVSGKMSY